MSTSCLVPRDCQQAILAPAVDAITSGHLIVEKVKRSEATVRSTARATLFAIAVLSILVAPAAGQGIPRTPDGKPDLRGAWVAPPLYNSNILEEHPGGFGIRAGRSVVIDPPDGKIPYQPWALAQRNENRKPENAYLDNEGRCILSGLPRVMLFEFNIEYAGPDILLFFGYVHTTRIIHMDGRPRVPENVRLWLGDSHGRWEGDTLVVETTNFNGKFWFALGGDFMTDAGRIVERFRLSDANTLQWEATITDPKAYTRPWTWKWNEPYKRGPVEEELDDDCHEGNADLDNLKATYDAARASKTLASADGSSAPAPERAPSVPTGPGKFTGHWRSTQSGGNALPVVIPSDLIVSHHPDELHVETGTSRQDPFNAAYKLDGSEVSVVAPAGITELARAVVQGETVVVTSKRSFTSPAGKIELDIRGRDP
jgi:hypothetical protein